MNFFGVEIPNLSQEEIHQKLISIIKGGDFHRVTTINPEFLVAATRNKIFQQNLQRADLKIVDGFGLIVGAFFRGKQLTRYPGSDLLIEIFRLAEKHSLMVFLAVQPAGLSTCEEIQAALLKKFPSLILSCDEKDLLASHIVLCNFGAPEQEYFTEALRKNPGNIRLAIGVGGALDFLTGKAVRAPKILRVLGLEWIWRLILQPKRFKRIWNAVVVFPFLFFMKKENRES